jgi:hypothetical protein
LGERALTPATTFDSIIMVVSMMSNSGLSITLALIFAFFIRGRVVDLVVGLGAVFALIVSLLVSTL